MNETELFDRCPVGSRWRSKRDGTTARIVRHTHSHDGRPLVIVEAETPAKSRNAWHPAVILSNRERVAS